MNLPFIDKGRVPEFWNLLGLLIIAVSLFSTKYFELPFWYVSIGIVCSFYGFGAYLFQLPKRNVYKGPSKQNRQPAN